MVLQKEFYFVRHGQTDHNILEGAAKKDRLEDIPLNSMGRLQSIAIEPIIFSLPVQSICSSPARRAQETKEIIAKRLECTHYDISELGECSERIWKELVRFRNYSLFLDGSPGRIFIDRVKRGLDQVLSLPGPSVAIAHAGVHWAICCLMDIEGHDWYIENCVPIHFFVGKGGKWIAKKLT